MALDTAKVCGAVLPFKRLRSRLRPARIYGANAPTVVRLDVEEVILWSVSILHGRNRIDRIR